MSGVVLSALVLLTTVVLVGQVTPGYSHFSDTVSRLASPGQPLALAARAGFVLYGILVMVGAGPLGDHLPGHERLLGGLIGVFGAAAVIAGIAPKDAPLAPHTVASGVHVGATVVGGTAILMAMVLVACRSTGRTERRSAATAAILTGVMVFVFKLSWGSQVYGLIERFLLASPSLWLIMLAIQLGLLSEVNREGRPCPPPDRREQAHASLVQARPCPDVKPSPWPHIVWATVVIGAVAIMLLVAGQTRQPEGQCSGIGFGCTLSGDDAAGLVAIVIVPPALGILAIGHAMIATGRRVLRHPLVHVDRSGCDAD